MRTSDLLVDGFGRVQEELHAAVEGLSSGQLAERLDADANSIAWLCWHLTRVQDDHAADAFGVSQIWLQPPWAEWAERFGLSSDDTGYGHSSRQVSQVRAPASVLTSYYDAVHERTLALVSKITDDDLDRVVDTRWDPPVTMGVRLVSVISDCLQHSGQAAFIRGILLRR
jgi:uncharacterized damage-inducible protein DinB